MTSDKITYLVAALFVFVVVASLFLVFKNGFKLEKMKSDIPFFRAKTKNEKRNDLVGEFVIGGTFILFLLILNEWTT